MIKLLEIFAGLALIFLVPPAILWWIHRRQEKKGYHRDYDIRYAHYMKTKSTSASQK
jgi:hypothetical protein